MKRRIAILLILFSSILSLVGCGNIDNDSQSTDTSINQIASNFEHNNDNSRLDLSVIESSSDYDDSSVMTPSESNIESSQLSKEESREEPSQPPKEESREEPSQPPREESREEPSQPPKEESREEPTASDSTFTLHFIDVGQADATLIECDGHYMLIDGGNRRDSNRIYAVLKKANVKKLDIVIATHPHEDHIGGLLGAFNYTTAKQTLSPVTEYDSDTFKKFSELAKSKGGGLKVPSVGSKYALGSATIEIFAVNSGKDSNNASIVLMITYGKTRFLFTGDAERDAEQVILNNKKNISATVLKVGHHGAENSTTYPFLRSVMPKYAVISVGKDNIYGHPADNTLSRLRDAGVKVYRTDMQGDIICKSDGENITFTVTKNPNADTLTNPPKEPEKDDSQQSSSEEQSSMNEESDVSEEPAHGEESEESETNNESSSESSVSGEERDYVLNTNTKKFHYPSCSSAKRISSKNREYFTGNREALIAEGYEPCKVCHP